MTNIGVIARLKVKEGKEKEFEKVFRELRDKVHANEKGCHYYEFFKARDAQGVYVVMERYASQQDLDEHGKTEYFRAVQKSLGPLMGGMPEVTFFDHIA